MDSKKKQMKLDAIAVQIRKDIVQMIYIANSGHLGGSLSIADLMAVLYWDILRVDPENPNDPDRDRMILSKGHTAPALYAALAERGFFPREQLFTGYRRINSILQGHPDMKKTPGVDMTSGSLGLGLSTGVGMAIGAKRMGKRFNVYVVVGDGETNEGGIWEAAESAAFYKLDNLYTLIDLNGMQNDGFTKDVMDMGNMNTKWQAFGWHVFEVDGHDVIALSQTIHSAQKISGVPKAIICKTTKGKGISFMENSVRFHGNQPTDEEYESALRELDLAAECFK